MRRAIYQTLLDKIDYPLDVIGALPAAAYSLRKLTSRYNGTAVRVRRASDNALRDIGFVRGVLDTNNLLTFCAGADGFVETWYDQVGNKNLAQTSGSQQPQIVFGGGLATSNGLVPTTYYRTTSTMLAPAPMPILAEVNVLLIHQESVRRENIVFDFTGSTQIRGAAHIPWSDGIYYWDVGDVASPIANWRVNTTNPQQLNRLQLVEMNHSVISNFKSIVVNGVELVSGVASSPNVTCNQFRLGVSNFEGLLSEVVVYNRLLTAIQRNKFTTNTIKYHIL